jgi:hypothetical protein
VTTIEELDAFSTKELHDRAFKLAEKKLDVGFFWKVFRAIPQAEAIEGHPDDAEADAHYISQWLGDFFDARDLGDDLRPFYVEYLVEHEQG